VLGYRLLRDADFDEMRQKIAALTDKLDAARVAHAATLSDAIKTHGTEVRELSSALAASKSSAASRLALYESLVGRANQLEMENAQYRNRVTGLPAIAAQIQKGSPLSESAIGAGVDLFADVGDDEARKLEDRGLLHRNGEAIRLPAAADLTAGLGGD